ncbi:MAG: hypothetical protein CVV06_15670 [Gammaproteobacteria bacterium HGW-Gammaproteobacteria-10]|nr:MAG: hypothetical protein CVV06_15670 [Gammaproteobacteria bacterium HGW-Gammaproteobacteria-10]
MEMKKSMLITAAAVIGLSVNTAYAHSDHDHGGGEPYTLFHPEMTWVDGTGTATNVVMGNGERTIAGYQFLVSNPGELDVYTRHTTDDGQASLFVYQKDAVGSDWSLTHWSVGAPIDTSDPSKNIFGVDMVVTDPLLLPGSSPAGLRDYFEVGEYMALVTIGAAEIIGTAGDNQVGMKLSQGFEWFFIDFIGAEVHDMTIGASPNSSVVVQPVPVPAAIWLMGSALVVIGAVGRKKPTTLNA